jgi:hypothetical protein
VRKIDPTLEPVGFTTRPDDSVAVVVDQVVRDLDCMVLDQGRVLHVYVFRDDLLAPMEVEELSSATRVPVAAIECVLELAVVAP